MYVVKYPYQLSFAGNPMRYLVSNTPGGVGETGDKSVIEISFTDIDSTPDHSIEVTCLGETRTFTLKSTPSSENHIPVADDSWEPVSWCETIYSYLIRDVKIHDSYDIAIDGPKIILTAKVASSDYDWSTANNTIVGITIQTTMNGMSAIPGSVEGVRMSLFKDGNILLGQDYKPVDSSGNVRFDIQEYIFSTLLQAAPPRFNLVLANLFLIFTDYLLKYQVSFCDRIAGVYQARTYGAPNYNFCYAMAGGLNREDLVANNLSSVDYFNLTATKKKFLTWSPPSRITDEFETHSLFFAFQNPSNPAFRLKLEIVTTTHSYPAVTVCQSAVTPWSVVEFTVGYAQLGLAARAHDIVKWHVYLVDGAGAIISDIREFVLDKVYHENTRYFRFRNSWGTYDSLRCTGVFESTIQHEREKVIFMSDEVETSFNAPGTYTMIKESQSYKANSGWLTKDYLNFLRDFMLSGDIFEVDGSRLLKCLLTSKKTAMFKDLEYNYSLAFEYESAYDDFFFQGLE